MSPSEQRSIAYERRRVLAHVLHGSQARVYALRVQARACHATLLEFEGKLARLADASEPLRELERRLRTCSMQLDRAVVDLSELQSAALSRHM